MHMAESDEDQIDRNSRERRTSKRLKEQKGKDTTQTFSFDDKFTNVEEEHVENNDKGADGHGEHMKPHHMHLYQTSSQRGRGRPSKAELEEREKGREEQIAKILEEKGEFYSLVLVNINNKLALQNGLWAQLKHSSSNK